MEELNQLACEHLARDDSIFPTVLGSVLASTIAIILALCLGYL